MGKMNKPKSRKQTKTKEEPQKSKVSDLFDNPMTKSAFMALSDEDKEKYKQWGEYFFGNIDIQDNRVLKSLPPPVYESVAYIISGLRSGLKHEDLEEEEINLMTEVYGEDWKTKFDFS